VLRSLTPAEQLAGYDEAIRNLGAKLDLILRANDDPSTFRQLEGAIAALRSIVSNVASNDALARLTDDVRALSAKVDQLSRSNSNSDSFAMLEQRIAALSSTLESRQPPAASDHSEFLESALRSLTERLDRIPVGNDNASAFAHLEQRVTYLLERLEASDRPSVPAIDLGRVEEGLHDILRSLERQHASLVSLAESNRNADAPQPIDSGIVDLVKRELSDIRFSQSETDRRTQDSLETVHSTLGHVVDRLSTIEGRSAHGSRAPVTPPPAPAPVEMHEETPRAPNAVAGLRAAALAAVPDAAVDATLGAAAETGAAESGRVARGFSGAFRRRAARISRRAAGAAADCPADPAARHQRNPGAARRSAAHCNCAGIAAGSPTRAGYAACRRACLRRRNGSQLPKARSAKLRQAPRSRSVHRASLPPRAAPRRLPPPRRLPRRPDVRQRRPRPRAATRSRPATRPPRTCRPKIRALLVGASVVVIVLGTFKTAMTLLETGSAPQMPPMENSVEPAAPAQAPAENSAKPAMPAPAAPSMISPTPVEKQSNNSSAPNMLDSARLLIPPQAAASPTTAGDITNAIPTLPATGAKACDDIGAAERSAA
jgi:localization factor PodJL